MEVLKLRTLTDGEKDSFLKEWKKMLESGHIPWPKLEIFEFEEEDNGK